MAKTAEKARLHHREVTLTSIDQWITEHAQVDPATLLTPELIEQLDRGIQAGLSWASLSRWLQTQGVDIPYRRLEAALRRAR